MLAERPKKTHPLKPATMLKSRPTRHLQRIDRNKPVAVNKNVPSRC